jgi:hypothetical protein
MITREDIDNHFAEQQAKGVLTSVKLDWESGKGEVIYDLHAMLAEANRYKQFMETEYPGWIK